MSFSINFLIKNAMKTLRYEKCRPLILHKIKDPSADFVGNLSPYRCSCICPVQNYNQFGYDRPSRKIKFILKETGFWNQLPRCIRRGGVSANQRVYWQTQHWFLIVYNLPDSSILTWFDGSLWGTLQPWLFLHPSWPSSLLGDCVPHLQFQCKHAELVYTHRKSDPRSHFKSDLIIMFTVWMTISMIPFKGSKILLWFLSVSTFNFPTQDVSPLLQFHYILLLFPLWLK